MEEKKSNGEVCSLEDAIVLKKMASRYQINLLLVIRDFLITRRRSEQFGHIAIEKGFATQDEVKHALAQQQKLFRAKRARKMVGEILVESEVITKEQQQVIAREQQQFSINETASVKNRIRSDVNNEVNSDTDTIQPDTTTGANISKAGYLDIKANGIDPDNIEVIVSKNTMEAWIKVPSDLYSQVAIISEKNNSNSISDQPGSGITSSEKQEFTLQKPMPVLLESIKAALEKKGVKNGICSNAILQSHIDLKDTFFPAAVGDYQYSPVPEYQFSFDHLVNDSILRRNKTLAFMKSGQIKTTTTDVFGKKSRQLISVESLYSDSGISASGEHDDAPLSKKNDLTPSNGTLNTTHSKEPGELSIDNITASSTIRNTPAPTNRHPVFRSGNGVIISADGLRVLSDQSGYPALSLNRKFYIFPVVNVLADADMRFGRIDGYASINVSGTLTGAYPVNAGQIRARETDGAQISSIGDISVEIGINRSRIKTQGNVRAKYIHNSRIEAFGDLYVEHEIIDSTIIISGACHADKSRIIASRISAKMGIVAAGVGSDVTEPCHISAGCEDHIVLQSREITRQIDNVKKELDDLMESRELLKQKIKDLFKKMVEFKITHDRAKASYLEFSQKIGGNADLYTEAAGENQSLSHIQKNDEISDNDKFDPDEKTARLIDALKTKMDTAVDQLRKYNQQKKNLEISLDKIENTIRQRKPKIEQQIMEMEIDRNCFLQWAKNNKPIPEIKISAKLAQGTQVKGIFSSMTVQEDIRNIHLIETPGEKNPERSEIKVLPLS